VGEVYGLELDSDLVVLSACELGLGKREKGEGVIGLTRAFMYAGTPSVVVSLWKVADQATMMLMEKFYSNMDKGMGKDQALQKAQLDLMQENFRTESGKEYSCAHPFFWAPFVLYGK
jgi:CHAT domain-containing protein